MTQQYTPVSWQDETTSQQGTLINAERLNQMQTAHHYADGFEEVDAVPTADPSVAYHKVVYCTADSTFYRWDGTEWTKDIDDETKALLQQEIARATAAEGELAQDLADETTRATAQEQELASRITAEASARTQADTALGGRIDAEATARESADTELGADLGAETARARQAEQANAQAIATHVADRQNPHEVTKAQVGLGNVDNTADLDKPISSATQSALDGKAAVSEVQSLDLRVDTLESGLADTYNKAQVDTYLAAKADSTALTTKLDTLSTMGLHAYTHNGATQSEVAVIDGTTASTIPIRDANGRLQAADPADGATDKTLVTANWVSQTGREAPNNLIHRSGNETRTGILRMFDGYDLRIPRTSPAKWAKIATLSALGIRHGYVFNVLIHSYNSANYADFKLHIQSYYGSDPASATACFNVSGFNNTTVNISDKFKLCRNVTAGYWELYMETFIGATAELSLWNNYNSTDIYYPQFITFEYTEVAEPIVDADITLIYTPTPASVIS